MENNILNYQLERYYIERKRSRRIVYIYEEILIGTFVKLCYYAGLIWAVFLIAPLTDDKPRDTFLQFFVDYAPYAALTFILSCICHYHLHKKLKLEKEAQKLVEIGLSRDDAIQHACEDIENKTPDETKTCLMKIYFSEHKNEIDTYAEEFYRLGEIEYQMKPATLKERFENKGDDVNRYNYVYLVRPHMVNMPAIDALKEFYAYLKKNFLHTDTQLFANTDKIDKLIKRHSARVLIIILGPMILGIYSLLGNFPILTNENAQNLATTSSLLIAAASGIYLFIFGIATDHPQHRKFRAFILAAFFSLFSYPFLYSFFINGLMLNWIRITGTPTQVIYDVVASKKNGRRTNWYCLSGLPGHSIFSEEKWCGLKRTDYNRMPKTGRFLFDIKYTSAGYVITKVYFKIPKNFNLEYQGKVYEYDQDNPSQPRLKAE